MVNLEKNKLSENAKLLINIIRRSPGFSKSELSTKTNIPWSTLSNNINELLSNNLLSIELREAEENRGANNCITDENQERSDNKEVEQITRAQQYGASITVNPDFQYYVGISVGNSNIKIVFLDFAFNLVKKSILEEKSPSPYNDFSYFLNKSGFISPDNCVECKWCTKTPTGDNRSLEIRHILKELSDEINKLKNESNFNITAICFTFPGHINYDSQKIIKTNLGFQSTNIMSIITSSTYSNLVENNIKCIVDHNIKSSVIAEKERTMYDEALKSIKNIMVAYMGLGCSIGLVLNQHLFRGHNNASGEWGHNLTTYKSLNGRYETKEFEKILVEDIFNDENCNFIDLTSTDLKSKISRTDNEKKRKLLVETLSTAINNIVNNLGIEHIIFSGKFHWIFEDIEMDLLAKFEQLEKPNLYLMNSYYGEYSAAVGAAMTCYYNTFSIPFEWK